MPSPRRDQKAALRGPNPKSAANEYRTIDTSPWIPEDSKIMLTFESRNQKRLYVLRVHCDETSATKKSLLYIRPKFVEELRI
jgi:hypothetical protein